MQVQNNSITFVKEITSIIEIGVLNIGFVKTCIQCFQFLKIYACTMFITGLIC